MERKISLMKAAGVSLFDLKPKKYMLLYGTALEIGLGALCLEIGTKYYIISIALIAQLVEQQVSTLKVVGSSLTGDIIVCLLIEVA